MKYQLAFSDLDGTLLNSNSELSSNTYRILEAAAERGFVFVPTTGREYNAIPEPIRQLPFVRYYCSGNGTSIYDRKEDRYIYRNHMTKEEAFAVFDYLDSLHIYYDCFIEDISYSDKLDQLEEYCDFAPGLAYIRSTRKPVTDLRTFIESKKAMVQMIVVFFAPGTYIPKELIKLCQPRFPELTVTSSIPFDIEIMAKNADKGAALRFLSNYLGISNEATIAFGDNLNDLPMVKAAGLGVIVANGLEEAKKEADLVAETNDEDGVGRIIERLILKEDEDD